MQLLFQQIALAIHHYTPTHMLWAFAALTILLLLTRKRRYEALVFALALLAITASVWFAKLLFAVPRPEDALVVLTSYAFPSGHAASGAFLMVMLLWLYRRFIPNPPTPQRIGIVFLLAGFAFLLGYSRIIIGVHTPLQVLAGFALGAIVPLCVLCTAARMSTPKVASFDTKDIV